MNNWQKHSAAIALASLAICKFWFLAAWGPISYPDTGGYLDYANRILSNWSWLTHIDMQTDAVPIMAFRMAGYPVLMAVSRSLFQSSGDLALILAQMALSLYVTARFFRMFAQLGFKPWQVWLGTACQATGMPLWLDQCLLTDSFYLSLVTWALILIVESSFAKSASLGRAATAGSLLLLAFLLRDASAILFFYLLPAGFLAARASGDNPIRSVIFGAMLVLPLIAGIVGYRAWNEVRTGKAFVTTAPHTNLLLAMIEAQKFDQRIFGADTALDKAARPNLKVYDFSDALAIADAWHLQTGIDSYSAAQEASSRFWTSWRTYPLAMARATLDRYHLNYLVLPFRPFESVDDILVEALGAGHIISPPALWQKLRSGNVLASVPLLVALLTQALAIGISLAFLAFPLTSRFANLPAPQLRLLLGLWFFVAAFGATHMMVHVERRHLAPLMPIIILIGLIGLNSFFQHQLERRHAHGTR